MATSKLDNNKMEYNNYYVCLFSDKNILKQQITCQRFTSFVEANEHFNFQMWSNSLPPHHASQIIPLCKYIPSSLVPLFLSRKLYQPKINVIQ